MDFAGRARKGSSSENGKTSLAVKKKGGRNETIRCFSVCYFSPRCGTGGRMRSGTLPEVPVEEVPPEEPVEVAPPEEAFPGATEQEAETARKAADAADKGNPDPAWKGKTLT
ncbi:hypothetical protein HKBW3S33_02293, partial [Candidatus Hakubella thermalkaliphila]